VHGVAAQSYKGKESEEADDYGGKIFFHLRKTIYPQISQMGADLKKMIQALIGEICVICG
jgi:hypothetical protein